MHCMSWKRCASWCLLWLLLLSGWPPGGVFPACGQTRVRTVITPDRHTTVTRTGTVYDIDGGRIRGSTLIHSFGRFDVGTHDTASFNGPRGIANILSRVTGGDVSDVDGILRTTIDGANLFLLNPSGVLFGPHAQLQVSGSFHVSTADVLRFPDGTSFYADPRRDTASNSLLRIHAPEAFGFLGGPITFRFTSERPAAITIDRSQLEVQPGKALSLLGGDVTIRGGKLTAPSGQLNIASMAASGAVTLNPSLQRPEASLRTTGNLGEVAFSAAAHLDVSSIDSNSASGTIVIRSGQVHISGGAQLNSNNAGGNRPGGMVTITATDLVRIAGNGSRVSSSSSGSQDAGRVHITAPTVRLEDGSLLQATAAGPGAAGDIVVRAPNGQIHLTQRAEILSTTTFPGPNGGMGGNIRLEAQTITLSETAKISANSTGTGQAGNIQLQAATITLRDGALVSASSRWTGDAGTIDLRATEIALRTRSAITTASAPLSPLVSGGRAGDIQVHAGRLSLTGGSRIDSNTAQGGGPGGMVSVTATETILIAGGTRNQPSALSSSTDGEQDAGQIEVTARMIRLEDGGRIEATTSGPGMAGTIQVRAPEGQVSLTRGAQILSTTNNEGGQGGNILLASGAIALSEGSLISARSTGSGNGGNIRLTAETITLRDRAQISAESTRRGDAGTLRLTATDTFLSQNSTITTEARQAQGGEIQLGAQNLVYLQQSQITTTVSGGDERAGNITIDPEFVVLQKSQVKANAAGGPGGNITMRAQVFLADPASAVTASSERNIDGEISIQAPVTNLSSIVAPLSQSYTPATELLRDQCAARWREGIVSSLVIREREGLPATPEGLLPGRRYEAEVDSGHPMTGGQPPQGMIALSPGGLHVEADGQSRLRNWSTAQDMARTWQWPCAAQ